MMGVSGQGQEEVPCPHQSPRWIPLLTYMDTSILLLEAESHRPSPWPTGI